MKYLWSCLLLVLLVYTSSAQETTDYESQFLKLKSLSVIDPADTTICVIMNAMFNEGLQSDQQGNLSESLINLINGVVSDSNAKNKYLIQLFFHYQNVVIQPKKDTKLQIAIMDFISKEMQSIFGKIPVIVYIYQAEAYNADKQIQEGYNIVVAGRQKYPDAIPLKVYQYKIDKKESLRDDIAKNHSNHWLVKRMKILD